MTASDTTAQHVDVLVIGGGEAGLGVATELRELGFSGTIAIIGAEPMPPYQRPPLSKGFITGSEDEESLTLRAPEYFSEHRIDVHQGRRVVEVDISADCGRATLDDASVVEFGRLAITTGADARALPVPGASLRNVFSLRTVQDARWIREALSQSPQLVVIGGGFIGLEVAAAANSRGVDVTVLEATGRLLERVCAQPLSDHCLREHRAAGIDVRLDTTVVELISDQTGAVESVQLMDGTTLPATMVIVGIGAVPATELAEEAGLNCQRGVVVDSAGRTARPHVVAAGDCTSQPHPHIDGELIAIESVNNAHEQSKAAAHALLGLDPPRRGTPWFWSDQGSMKIQIAGISHGFDEYVVREDAGRLTVLYFRAGRLIAADVVNHPRDFMAVKRALGEGHSIDPARARDLNVSLKELIKQGS